MKQGVETVLHSVVGHSDSRLHTNPHEGAFLTVAVKEMD